MSDDVKEEVINQNYKTYFQKLPWWVKGLYFLTLACLIILLVQGKCDQYGAGADGKNVCLQKSFQLWLILPIIMLIMLLIWFSNTLKPRVKLTDRQCLEALKIFIADRQADNIIPNEADVTILPVTKPQWLENEIDHRWYGVTVDDKLKNEIKDYIWYINVWDGEYGFEESITPFTGRGKPHVIKEFKAETRDEIEMKRRYHEELVGKKKGEEEEET